MSERGLALVAVVLALVILGALVAAGSYAAQLEQRAGRHTLYATQAAEAAEAGLAELLASWEAHPELGALAVNGSLTLARIQLGNGVSFETTVLRVQDRLYLLRADGSVTDASGNVLARHAVGVVSRVAGSFAMPLGQRSWAALY
jgi:hypothetical protein